MDGASMIVAERARQGVKEGWTDEHDDLHANGELARAAAVYATVTQENVVRVLEGQGDWPWDMHWFKPFADEPTDPMRETTFPAVDRIRCLVKAGALIAAEIDRLQRLDSK